MTSFQFKLWRLILKSQFSKSANNKEIDLKKARRFESPTPPERVKKKCDIDKESILDKNVFILNPKNLIDNDKILIYFHGGGYITGLTTPYWHFVTKLSNYLGLKIILPDYPIAPETNYQDTINFSIELYKDILQKFNNSKIYLIGDSCGGGLVLSISQKLKEIGLIQPEKIILLSPWLDLSMNNPDIIGLQKDEVMLLPEKLKKTGEMYSADLDIKNPLVSPINADITIFPEIHLFIGTHDILLADSKKFTSIAKKSGVEINYYEYDKMIHCWMIFPIPEAKRVMNKINDIIKNKV
jgi:epsilon-lactone hydrolase